MEIINSEENFLKILNYHFINYKRIVEIISSVFVYLVIVLFIYIYLNLWKEKVFIYEQMNTTLENIFLSLFNNLILQRNEIKKKLEKILKIVPSNIDPSEIRNVIICLYQFDKSIFFLNL